MSVGSSPILGTTADGTASAESARGLLLTVMGEFAVPNGGSAWTRTVVELLGGLDVKDKAARQALARMERPRWLERKRQGRNVRWVVGDDLRARLESGGERIYRLGRRRPDWDGQWLVLSWFGGSGSRSAEFRLTRSLRWAGFGPGPRGTWICPWVNRREATSEILRSSGIDDVWLFESRLMGFGSDAELAAEAWDLDVLAERYEVFLEAFDRPVDTSIDGFEAAVALAELVHRWRTFPLVDPELPSLLLPDDWPGREAAELFTQRRRSLQPAALQWWRRSEA